MAKHYITLMLMCCSVQAAQYYVSPIGSSNAAGSISAPWDIHSALLNTFPGDAHTIQPGDTVWCRGGTYVGKTQDPNKPLEFWNELAGHGVSLNGTSNQPIYFRAYPFERPILDGRLAVNSSYVWYWGLEVTVSNAPPPITQTRDQQDADLNTGTGRRGAVDIAACEGVKFINCIFHDNYASSGIGVTSTNLEVNGCIWINNGRHASDYSSGHGVYVQNLTGTKTFYDTIFANNFLNGANFYSAGSSPMNNLTSEGNILFGNGYGIPAGNNMLAGAEVGVNDLQVISNTFFNALVSDPNIQPLNSYIGQGGSPVVGLVFTNNVLVYGGFAAYQTTNPVITGNRDFSYSGILLRFTGLINGSTWDNNEYQSSYSVPFNLNDVGMSFTNWKTNSADANSTLSVSAPSGTIISVRPNKYESGRANVAIINWDDASTVNVNLSGIGLTSGQWYEIRAVQDFFGMAVTNCYTNATVAIPMTGWTVSQPRSLTAALANETWVAANPTKTALASTFPRFGAFVVRSISPRSEATATTLRATTLRSP